MNALHLNLCGEKTTLFTPLEFACDRMASDALDSEDESSGGGMDLIFNKLGVVLLFFCSHETDLCVMQRSFNRKSG